MKPLVLVRIFFRPLSLHGFPKGSCQAPFRAPLKVGFGHASVFGLVGFGNAVTLLFLALVLLGIFLFGLILVGMPGRCSSKLGASSNLLLFSMSMPCLTISSNRSKMGRSNQSMTTSVECFYLSMPGPNNTKRLGLLTLMARRLSPDLMRSVSSGTIFVKCWLDIPSHSRPWYMRMRVPATRGLTVSIMGLPLMSYLRFARLLLVSLITRVGRLGASRRSVLISLKGSHWKQVKPCTHLC